MQNIILMSDSYKFSHNAQYPENITYMHSYLESRGGSTSNIVKPNIKFFGLQYYIKKYLSQEITKNMVDEAQEVLKLHGLPFPYDGWMKVVTEHSGQLPLRIRAVKEGVVVPRRNVLMTIESTDEKLFWLVGWVETLLLKVWYPTTVATFGYNVHKMLKQTLIKSADTFDSLPFMLHDFGYRGVSSEESAAIGGLAHLTNFAGTDTLAAIMCGRKYYNSPMAGFSIPASEHSTITCWGDNAKQEKLAYQNMIKQFSSEYNVYACVSDSWDFARSLDMWEELKDDVIANKGTLVIRPDSGDAKTNILLGLDKLSKSFGYKVNQKGYKVLNNVKLIQGDGVHSNEIYDILNVMIENGYSADNISFGIGGSLLQGNEKSSINRDTHKFAIKCSAIIRDNKLQKVYKNPITDQGKKSKKGRLDLIIDKKTGNYKTIVLDKSYKLNEYHKDSILELYYENGKVHCDYSIENCKNI